MNEARRIFAREVALDGKNATQAAIAAGYSSHSAHVTGSRLLKDVEVVAEIERLRHEVTVRQAARRHFTREDLIERALRIAEDAEVPASARVAALRLVSDVEGYEAPKRTESVSVRLNELPEALRDLSPDTLKRLAFPRVMRQIPAPVDVMDVIDGESREIEAETPYVEPDAT